MKTPGKNNAVKTKTAPSDTIMVMRILSHKKSREKAKAINAIFTVSNSKVD